MNVSYRIFSPLMNGTREGGAASLPKTDKGGLFVPAGVQSFYPGANDSVVCHVGLQELPDMQKNGRDWR
ncbi:MAG: hypothetical protein DMG85_04010 [Acidobacteria bacterium]|nr:MAG: hypothetical protein DMG85_04010 [Acidobacteriota bacterium]